jgi:hypothetical protein
VVIVVINVTIALLHFVTGSDYRGPFPEFVNGYLLDILIPFGFYFLLSLSEVPPLRSWVVRSLVMFAVGSCVEIAQFFGVPLFGRTFDPLDFAMYGLGAGLAPVFDLVVFPRIFRFWAPRASAE